MFRKFTAAAFGLFACVQTASIFAGGSSFGHHHHHQHHFHHNHGQFVIQPFPRPIIRPQPSAAVFQRVWTPSGWVLVKTQPSFSHGVFLR